MKKVLVLMMAAVVLLASCAQSKKINVNGKTKTYEPHGWADMDEKSDSIHYQVSVGNVALSVVFCESVVVPVVLTGWYLWEPVCTEAEWKAEHE